MTRRAVRLAVAVAAALVCLPVVWVQVTGRRDVAAGVADVTRTPVAIVFGAGLRPDGTPSVYLTRRLQAARELYDAGTVGVVLVSGDNSRPSHDEPTAMRDWLVAHGVPSGRVVLDHAGFDTHDTCVRAVDVFGVTDAVLVTQDYHLPRAMYSCRAAGVHVQGVGVSASSVTPAQALVWHLRELPASWKAWWDALTHRPARYPGPRETSLARALHDAGRG